MLLPVFTCIADFIDLIYPQLCSGCRRALVRPEKTLCTHCLYDLPYADFYQSPQNLIAQQFWGRIVVEQALAIWLFNKGSRIQHILHNIKYHGDSAAAVMLGKLAGRKLEETIWFCRPDLIVPVPLSRQRQKKRGYNQSEKIAQGISEILKIPVCNDLLIRTGNAVSQTRKSRYHRYQNMKDQFTTGLVQKYQAKHALLIDDVITTGATLEACTACLAGAGWKVSICAAAYAE